MKLLLQAVKVYDKNSKHHLETVDVLIKDGVIHQIAKNIKEEKDYQVFKSKNACISATWVDMNMHIYEPGLEYREDYKSGLNAAGKAGYGFVCIMPNTNPTIDNNTQVEFVKNASNSSLTKTWPLGAVSQHVEGKDLAEIYDMQKSGAVAFTDGSNSILNAGLMERALLYVKKFDGLVYSNPDNTDISAAAQMNEGINSTILGMEGAPQLAEELMVARDLFLLEHTNSKVHFINISTKKSVELIKAAKAKGLNVTAGVNVANLFFDDSEILDFETNFKVKPHLRTKEDIKALLKGLKDGTIDTINSGHKPLHIDEKKVEFENASFGMSTIDCAFAAARTATKKVLSEEQLIEKLTNAYQILNKEKSGIEVNQKANFTIFDLNKEHEFTIKDIHSKGKNNPFVGQKLIGKALGIVSQAKTNLL